jgi:hypothetical protein
MTKPPSHHEDTKNSGSRTPGIAGARRSAKNEYKTTRSVDGLREIKPTVHVEPQLHLNCFAFLRVPFVIFVSSW